jgi:hypothetical protein
MSDNELAVGTFCECGTRLDDKAGVHPCPMGCEEKR